VVKELVLVALVLAWAILAFILASEAEVLLDEEILGAV